MEQNNLADGAPEERDAHNKKLERFQATHSVLPEQIHVLLETRSLAAFDALIASTRQAMKESWTTHGLKFAMGSFFVGNGAIMDTVNKQSHRIKAVNGKFHTEHGLPAFRCLPIATACRNARRDRSVSQQRGAADHPGTFRHFEILHRPGEPGTRDPHRLKRRGERQEQGSPDADPEPAARRQAEAGHASR